MPFLQCALEADGFAHPIFFILGETANLYVETGFKVNKRNFLTFQTMFSNIYLTN